MPCRARHSTQSHPNLFQHPAMQTYHGAVGDKQTAQSDLHEQIFHTTHALFSTTRPSNVFAVWSGTPIYSLRTWPGFLKLPQIPPSPPHNRQLQPPPRTACRALWDILWPAWSWEGHLPG